MQELRRNEQAVLGTDRNAVVRYARFTDADDELTDLVDWRLMRERLWKDTAEDPDRCERRQAELLVHQRVPWDSILGVAMKTEAVKAEVEQMIVSDGSTTRLAVRPTWYF